MDWSYKGKKMNDCIIKINICELENDIRKEAGYIGGRFPPTDDFFRNKNLWHYFN